MNRASVLASIPILTYHKIDTVKEWGLNVVSPENFRQQMEWLREQGYQTVTFRNWHKVEPHSAPPIILTFDDGYESVYRYAFPVLQEVGFTAVVFVVTGYRGKWNTWDANLGGIRFRHLNDDQLRHLWEAGWELGSHTVSHRALIYLNDAEVRRELEESRAVLENLTGAGVTVVAYPFGRQNARIRRMAHQAGYRFGCRNLWGHTGNEELLALKRIPVYGTDSLKTFRRKLEPGVGHTWEMLRLRAISWPARLTGMYQVAKMKVGK